jgi:glutathione S-transferase
MELFELGGPGGRRYSVFSWRTRLGLAHKGIAFTARQVAVADKAAIAFSGQDKVPILKDGATVVYDSWRIAEYLEATYPERPLFGGEVGRGVTKVINAWADRTLIPILFPALMLENVHRLDAADAAHMRAQIEKVTGKSLEDLAAGRAAAVKAFGRALDPVRATLRGQAFLSGAQPAYADYIVFSLLQWPRVVSPEPVLAAEDAVAAWFERMLDAHGGMGRAEPAAN